MNKALILAVYLKVSLLLLVYFHLKPVKKNHLYHTTTVTGAIEETVPRIKRKNLHRDHPTISFFLRLSGKRQDHRERFYCMILKTVALFWPGWLGKIVIVFDEESQEDHTFAAKLLNQTERNFPSHTFETKYEPLPKDPSVLDFPHQLKPPGYNRQLWSSFFIDLYSNDEIIAWMDSDSPLLLPVTVSTVMPKGKVRILGSECTMLMWARTTEKALGFPQIADFMTYFPVYLYRDTFTRCRQHILKRFNTDNFEEAFRQFYHTGTGLVSPVSVVISYAWFFEKDRYDWNMKVCSDLKKYNERLPQGHKIRQKDTVNANVLFTQPQTAYHGVLNTKDFYAKLIPISYCLSIAEAGRTESMCKKYPQKDIKKLFSLFKSDTHSSRVHFPHPCTGNRTEYCLEILKTHFRKVGVEIKTKKRIMEWHDFAEKVNVLASEVGVTCAQHPE